VRFRRERRDAERPVAEAYSGLRQQVLALTPDQLGDAIAPDAPIVALLMETGYPEAVATLVAVADGTTSLYFSNGGGVTGAGTHGAVADASRRWLHAGIDSLPQLPAITEVPLPDEGMTQFVAVRPDGLRGVVASEDELGEGRHILSPLFHAGHDVITQIRLAEGG
jgi:hypothetical protein